MPYPRISTQLGTSIVAQPESSKSVFQKSSGRLALSPTQLNFQSPFSDMAYGVAGSSASVSADASSASGIAYVRAGSLLIELTAGFSQSLGSSAANAPQAAMAAMNAILFISPPWFPDDTPVS